MADFSRESMLDMFIYEMNQLVEQLEQLIIQGEQGYSMDDINEIFRIMHTIKGSAAMMLYDNVSKTAHSAEDLFFFLREENPQNVDYSTLTDLVLECVDFIKNELAKIEASENSDGNPTDMNARVKAFLAQLKGEAPADAPPAKSEKKTAQASTSTKTDSAGQIEAKGTHYNAKIFFEEGCEMESVRAFTLLQNIKDAITDVVTIPEDVVADGSEEIIKKEGFQISFFSEKTYDEISDLIDQTVYLKGFELSSGDLKNYKVVLFFEEGCEMENVRAYTVIHNLQGYCTNIKHEPEDIIDEAATELIRKNGFKFSFSTDKNYEEVSKDLCNTVFLKAIDIEEISSEEEEEKQEENELKKDIQTVSETVSVQGDNVGDNTVRQAPPVKTQLAQKTEKSPQAAAPSAAAQKKAAPTQHMISVNIGKLDQLLNLMGELVIAEAMTTQNPDLEGLDLENFNKSARQLRKIINDVQDTVMSMRMVSLSTTFFKMNRIVRDMCKNLGKDVQLEVVGEETEVDKNIIEHLSDPLMHIIRNSVDHGIEMPDERKAIGKPEKGTVLLEARNAGGEVIIIVKDDGQGLDTQKIFNKAKENGLLKKPENEYTEREIHQFIFHPGLSTNDQVTNYSGRGVGMDVVMNNIETVGGTISVESEKGEGTTNILKIPLTLAIVEGMLIKMGGAKYTIPISSIQETFKAKQDQVFKDPDGNEMLTLRGDVYNIVRLYDFFGAKPEVTNIEEGVLIMLENEGQHVCLFVDELIGEQQVVVKTMPGYINRVKGISGCTLLGNGDISLIIDVGGFFDK